ncbi:oligosaccharide flippase family protein [Snuella sedimenti]|uniref:Oligosaccharide flippase family protein n=1 Tax=Snuella sedimenti TaxID=2798802 RepID=A0A8J7IW66_9FLAO|nr:oligosaccharide flippase family protein [Snuella sedimenti]MBJ6368155.1 oligosaccharide flippase family protein [Snuella sedimenti]
MGAVNKNIIANIIGRGLSMISVFIFIPIYISILGAKMYGVISFYVILQGILIFADAGLTATLKRELAKGDDSFESRFTKFKILRSIEVIYIFIVFLIGFSIFCGSDFIVDSWLNIEDLDFQSTKSGIQLMGIALGFNFLSTLYQGGVIGLEKQIASNFLQIVWGVLKNGGVIIAVLLIDKSLTVFFGWQLIINILYVIILRIFLLKVLKKKDRFKWVIKTDFKILKSVWKYAVGMFIIAVIASINSQFDKIVLSSYLVVSELTIYTVAYSLSTIPVVLSGPIATAIFPRLTQYFDRKNNVKLYRVFNNSFNLVLLLATTAGTILAFYSGYFLEIWTQNKEIAIKGALPATFLLLSQVLLSLQVIPFYLALAKGNTKINIIVGLLGIITLIPIIIVVAKYYDIVIVALTTFLYYLIITPIYIGVIVYKLTNLNCYKWGLNNLVKPIIIIVLGSSIFYFINLKLDLNFILKGLYILITSIAVFIISFSLTFKIKLKNIFKFIKNELFT